MQHKLFQLSSKSECNPMRCGIFDSASTSRTATPASIIYPCRSGCDGYSVSRLSKTGIIPRSGCNVLASLIGRASIVSGMACNVSRLASAASSSTSPPHCPSILIPSIGIHVDWREQAASFRNPASFHAPSFHQGAACLLFSIDRDSNGVNGAETDVTDIAGCSMQQGIVVPPEQKGFYYGFTRLELGSVWWPVPPVDRCLPLNNRFLLLDYTILAGYRH
ncbi:uncharacterized protein BO87DRAFT_43596 [Aspergillus neoniger CBS 115656]|uniref:Uncharacterized protein n=1 Tax=Aspergillus neoniger (strain CBS 115656) TaxID=1448310 RepID=A0A318ZF71_ASPNB|nr:hypothetical protein BO87DRAFT_43596 [Aspergillus neoniger CBS 115656]PYH34802.1 hypothetical protein BO87DRAFT_43596 [Aspergillus neoniger CBS 115656]